MFVIWFLFEESDQKYISQIIKELSSQYNFPTFIPHITAHGLMNLKIEEIEKVVLNTIKGIKQFYVEKNKVFFSDDFWKTLFIDISQNNDLIKISKKLKDGLPLVQKYDFEPHISLMYKNLGRDKKEKIAETLAIKNNFKINKLGILEFSNYIEEWKIIHEYKFEKY